MESLPCPEVIAERGVVRVPGLGDLTRDQCRQLASRLVEAGDRLGRQLALQRVRSTMEAHRSPHTGPGPALGLTEAGPALVPDPPDPGPRVVSGLADVTLNPDGTIAQLSVELPENLPTPCTPNRQPACLATVAPAARGTFDLSPPPT